MPPTTCRRERDLCRRRRTRQKTPEDDISAQRPEIGDHHVLARSSSARHGLLLLRRQNLSVGPRGSHRNCSVFCRRQAMMRSTSGIWPLHRRQTSGVQETAISDGRAARMLFTRASPSTNPGNSMSAAQPLLGVKYLASIDQYTCITANTYAVLIPNSSIRLTASSAHHLPRSLQRQP